jgi:RNA polymerase sigma-70 factor (ECF subfamily)
VGTAGSEHELVLQLRDGDEQAFIELVERYHPRLVRLARAFVSRAELAEDAAQETWIALVTGIDAFEERSSLRTWLFQICVNRARSIGARENRSIPVDLIEPAAAAEHFAPSGGWTLPPTPWPEVGDETDDRDLVAAIIEAIAALPPLQRSVVTIRDVDGLTSRQACEVLSISDSNQRVLLHRGRAQIRRSIDGVLRDQLARKG